MTGPKLAIVIPTHNESRTIARVLQGLLDLDLRNSASGAPGAPRRDSFAAESSAIGPDLTKEIIVVDDGSSDKTAEIARSMGVVVVTHLVNRGLGGALGTGIQAALQRGADLVVTFDADGQHAPEDIPKVIAPILAGWANAVIGSRMLKGEDITPPSPPLNVNSPSLWGNLRGGRGALGEMPWYRRAANHLANLVTWALFGIRTTDSQSGLRAFSRFAAERIRITSNNYEVSSEICGEIGRLNLRFTEVPIRPIYTDYSLSKGQGFVMGLKTLLRLLFTLTGR